MCGVPEDQPAGVHLARVCLRPVDLKPHESNFANVWTDRLSSPCQFGKVLTQSVIAIRKIPNCVAEIGFYIFKGCQKPGVVSVAGKGFAFDEYGDPAMKNVIEKADLGGVERGAKI